MAVAHDAAVVAHNTGNQLEAIGGHGIGAELALAELYKLAQAQLRPLDGQKMFAVIEIAMNKRIIGIELATAPVRASAYCDSTHVKNHLNWGAG